MRRALTWLFFGALTLVLVLTLTKTIKQVLPGGLGGALANNSEGVLLALVLGLWIQFVRPRHPAGRGMMLAVAVGLGFALIGLWLALGPLEHPQHSRFITLNETAFALAVLLPYLQLRRPLGRWWLLLPLAAIVIPAVGGSNEVTTDLAESFAALVLIPLTFDWIDRGALDGTAVDRARVWSWLALMVLAVISFHTVVDWGDPNGLLSEVWLYLARGNEMFCAAGALTVYFSLLQPGLRAEQAASPLQRGRAAGAVAGVR